VDGADNTKSTYPAPTDAITSAAMHRPTIALRMSDPWYFPRGKRQKGDRQNQYHGM